ncbi:histidine kinase [Microbacterium sp. X-17]|uniref:sensor histidine kinase n=1 Tax=Microbacterium sp. X-17 TaxID=3144404 RepID=UPI0031F5984E
MVTLAVLASLVIDMTTWSIGSTIEIAALLACAVFAWRPWVATILVVFVGLAATLVGFTPQLSLLLAVVSGLVIYACTAPLIAAYLLVAATLLMTGWAQGYIGGGGAIAISAIGLASSAVGVAIRRTVAARQRLEKDLARRERETEIAVRQERERMTDELHDIVAHNITIAAMHARALPLAADSTTRTTSLHAISEATGQALVDIRRILHVETGSDVRDEAEQPPTIAEVVEEVRSRLEAAGIPTELAFERAPDDEGQLSLNVATTVVRVARELANNVIVHAPQSQAARIAVTMTERKLTVSVWNDVPAGPASTERSGGYGIDRMRERARLADGEFDAAAVDGGWLATLALPRV